MLASSIARPETATARPGSAIAPFGGMATRTRRIGISFGFWKSASRRLQRDWSPWRIFANPRCVAVKRATIGTTRLGALHSLAAFAAKDLRIPGPGTAHTERMERPRRTLPQGSRQVLGSPRPRITVRDTRGSCHAWRAGCGETRTSGSERGMKKPVPATGQGASSLLCRRQPQPSSSYSKRRLAAPPVAAGLGKPSDFWTKMS